MSDTPKQPRQWTSEETDMVHRFANRGWTSEMIAGRFINCSADDVKAVLTKPPLRDQAKPVKTAQELEKENAEALKSMDALQKLFMDLVAGYNRMGESLKPIAVVMSMNLDLPVLQQNTAQIAALWRELVIPDNVEKPTLDAYIAKVLHTNFIIVPRPLLTVREEPTKDVVGTN